MKKNTVVLICTGIVFLTVSAFTFFDSLHSGGIVFQTGSPYDGGSTCSQIGCHTGGATVPTVSITATPAFATGNKYTPGFTYTINVTGSGSYPKYGFDLEILNSTDPVAALDQGIFGNVGSNCQKMVNAGVPTNICHLLPSGSGNTATFSFEWTAPVTPDTAFLYCSVLGSNNNASNAGDKGVKASMVLLPDPNGVALLDENKFQLSVFPNPVKNKINISYVLERSTNVLVCLYNLRGETVSVFGQGTKNSGKQNMSLELPAAISQGIYFLKISTQGGSSIQKIIITN